MSHRQPVQDIAFIASFAAFCRTKGEADYNCLDPYACALAQFGYPGRCAGGRGVPERAFKASATPGAEPQTFSALADRLEALIAHAPAVEQVS